MPAATPPTKRPVVIVIRDGWGRNPDGRWDNANAVALARHPVADRLWAEYPGTLVHTSGFDVGLPEGTMGNSEVGHQNIGAGRIVDQESVKITKEVRNGTFLQNAEMLAAVATRQTARVGPAPVRHRLRRRRPRTARTPVRLSAPWPKPPTG